MGVSLAGTVLFLHIGVAIVAFMVAAVLHLALLVLPRAEGVSELRTWSRVIARLEKLLPISALLLLVLGAWLVQLGKDEDFSWKSGWIVTAVVTLVVVEGLAGAIIPKNTKQMLADIDAAPSGPASRELRAGLVRPPVWYVANVATFSFLGVVFIMASKPSGAWAWLFPVVGGIVGVLAARRQLTTAAAAVAGKGSRIDPIAGSLSDPAAQRD